MALDPQVEEYYREKIKTKSFGLGTEDIALIRKGADETYNDRHVTETIWRSRDTAAMRSGGGSVPLRVYRPDGGAGKPVILYFHGGGFIMHNIASHDSLCRFIAKAADAAVVSVGYRLAPEHPYPAALEDGLAALSWTAENAESFGGDPGMIVLGGDSAGATISAAVALQPGRPDIAALMLLYGMYGAVPVSESETVRRYGGGDFVLPKEMIEFCDRMYLSGAPCAAGGRYDPGLDPYYYGLMPGRAGCCDNVPPSYIISAEYDPLRQDGEAFAERMAECGVRVRQITARGMMHGFALLYDRFDRGAELLRRICREIREDVTGRPGR